MFCPKCRAKIDDEAVVCVHCGVPTPNYYNVQNKQNQNVQNFNKNSGNKIHPKK